MVEHIIGVVVAVFGIKYIADMVDQLAEMSAKKPINNNKVKVSKDYNWGPDVLDDNVWYRGCYPKHDGTYIIRCEVEGHDAPVVLIADYYIINGEPRWSVDFGKVIPDWYKDSKVTLVEWSKFL